VAVAAVSAAQRLGVDDLAEHAAAALLESAGRAGITEDAGRNDFTDRAVAALLESVGRADITEDAGRNGFTDRAVAALLESAGSEGRRFHAAGPGSGAGAGAAGEMSMQERREWLTEHGDVSVAIVGRPNVGKSTLVNRLLGTERLLTGPTAGLTRDSTAVSWEFEGRRVALIDTAGLRRASRFDWSGSGGGLDSASASAARAALGGAGVVVLVVDSETGLTRQDAAIAQAITREGRPIVVAANRVDAVPDRSRAMTVIAEQADHAVADARGAAVVGTSALAGVGVESLMPAVMDAHRRWSTRISTSKLNSWFQRLCITHPPPSGTRRRSARPHEHKGKPTTKQAALRISYVTQVNARPPTFAIFCNKPSLPPSYHRFLVGALREEFDLWGVPIRIRMRNKAASRNKDRPAAAASTA
jgi:small GTP-binding protein